MFKEKQLNIYVCVLFTLSVFFLPVQTLAKGGRFYFVQITDTHLGIPENNARTKKVVEAINALPMEIVCVVHTGDIYDRTSRGNEKKLARAADIFKDLIPPIYFVPGNNEIDLFNNTLESQKTYTSYFGPLISSAQYQGVSFVFAYTDPLRESIPLKGFDPLKEINGELNKAEGKPVLLFHHGSSVRDFYLNEFHDPWKDKIRKPWLTLVNQNNVKAVIAGHFHRDEFHWLGNVPLYVSGPVAEKFGRQACFRIYEYRDGRIEYTAQYLE